MAVFLIACCTPALSAQSFSFTGNFAQDDGKQTFTFTLAAARTATARSWSYAGGVNGAGAAIPAGGFDPTLSLFDANGVLIGGNRDGGCGAVAADSTTTACWDSFLTVALPAGSYTLVLTESENLANGPYLADSFVYDGQGNFTARPGDSAPAGFWDFTRNQRTGSWAVDISGVDSATLESQVAAPTFSPAAGSYTTGQIVTISTITPGAQVRYTLGDAVPDQNSTLFQAGQPIAVCQTETINAIAFAPGLSPSEVSTASYTISGSGAMPSVREYVRLGGRVIAIESIAGCPSQ